MVEADLGAGVGRAQGLHCVRIYVKKLSESRAGKQRADCFLSRPPVAKRKQLLDGPKRGEPNGGVMQ